jgi:hypothetical protein
VRRFSRQRLLAALVLIALVPAGVELPALATLAILVAVLAAVIAYERTHFAELRARLRNQLVTDS